MAPTIQSLSGLLEHSVRKHAARTLFLHKSGERWLETSYAEFAAAAIDVGAGLSAMGVTHGDRVAVIANNSVEWAAVAYATYGLGAALVPMYESQREKDWEYILRDSAAKVLFVSTPEIFARVAALTERIPSLEHVACIAGEAPLTYAKILENGRKNPISRSSPGLSDTAALLYTSGTTGEPKGVVLSHGNILANVLSLRDIVAGSVDRLEEQRSLAFLPWAHAFGHTVELHVMIAAGASLAIAEAVDKVVDNIREVRPTVLVAVPRVFLRIHAGVEKLMAGRSRLVRWLFRRGLFEARRRAEGKPLSVLGSMLLSLADSLIFSKIRARFGGRLQFAISGAAALPREVAEFIDGIGITVYEGYGLTECSPIVSANTPGQRKLGSAGKPLPGVRIVIDKSVSHDANAGEIVVYGDNVMQGYYRQDEENRRVFAEGHGLRTGDLGYLDGDDFLFVTGRIKEQYKLQNAKYVAPSPLEDRLKLSPLIENVMIYGDNKAYNVALIVPDAAAVASLGFGPRPLSALCALPEVRQRFAQEIERLSAEFKGYERVRSFAFVLEDFTQENGTLTPSLKLKRHEIVRRFAPVLEGLYESA
jgi:long-chain acyl-CoA synthetase